MTIHELTPAECEDLLSRATFGRLGCSHGGQPYIVPISIYFDPRDRCLYAFSTLGQKIEWMRKNPKVCVELDEVADQTRWTTVVVVGRYDELDGPEQQRERQRALDLFKDHPRWWLPAGAKLSSGVEHASPVVYRILISSISGRRAVRA